MKRRIIITVIIFLIVVLFIGGCRQAGPWLVKDDHPVHADFMVMLMGSIPDRILQVSDLYEQGVAGKLVIVEESMGAYRILQERGATFISNTEQVRRAAIDLGIPSDSIIVLPGDASSTQMEACIVRDFLKEHFLGDTLVIVSTPDHTRRASMIFGKALEVLDKKPVVLCSPSAYTAFDPGKWWKDREGIQKVLLEYLKIWNFVLFERSDLKEKKQ